MSGKTKVELLAQYKRANTEYKKKILIREGYGKSNEKGYLDYLNNNIVPKVDSRKISKHCANTKPVINNVHILDISGSMGGEKLKSAIIGINDEVRELQQNKEAIFTHTLVTFSGSTQITSVYFLEPINNVKDFNTKDIGMTALYQAIGETLEKLFSKVKFGEKTLVKIFTDGGENGSVGKYKDTKVLREFIKTCEGNGFTITFVGTQTDTENIIKQLSIDSSNTLVHDNTTFGIKKMANTRSVATANYVSAVVAGEDVLTGFYTKTSGTL